MSIRFLPQVLPQAPGPLNFQPVANALAGIRQQQNQNALMDQRQAEFEANEQYRQQQLAIAAEKARQGPAAPDAVRQYEYAKANGFGGSFMDFKAAARPQMFGPVVVGDALVARSGPNAGTPIYQKPKSAMERAAEGIVQRYAPGAAPAPAQDAAPQPIPQSAPGGAPFAGAQPITYETPQPAAPANVDPMLINAAKQYEQTGQVPPSLMDMSPEELTILKGNKDTANFGKAIEDAQNARNAGVTFSPKTINDLQSDTMAKTQLLSDLRQIDRTFKPEYQTYFTKARMVALRQGDKLGMLTKDQEQALADFTDYRQYAYTNLNNYIKSITGAAMSIEEAKRITKGMPNPGDNFWDGDTPIEARRKIDNAIEGAELSLARLRYLQNKGKMPRNGAEAEKLLSLNGMKNVIMKQTRQRYRSLLQQGVDQQTAVRQAEQSIRQEYGI